MRHSLDLALVLVVCAAVSIAAQKNIPAEVARAGSVKIFVLGHEPPVADLSQLTSDSDIIVRAVIESAASRLHRSGESILTDYSARVTQLVRTNRTSGDVPAVVRFTLLGGKMQLPNGAAEFVDGNFPYPHVGDEYVFFLRRQGDQPQSFQLSDPPDPGKYVVVHGPFGAYRVADGQVSPVVGKGNRLGRIYDRKNVVDFLSDIVQVPPAK